MAEIRDNRQPRRDPPQDYGGEPLVMQLGTLARENNDFRSALWTGHHLQLTMMSIDPGGEIGVEMHPDVDQLLRVESGRAAARFGNTPDRLVYETPVSVSDAVLIPAGTWHNVVNTGNRPLKLTSVYAPPQHPFGTRHRTAEEARAAEEAEQQTPNGFPSQEGRG